MEEQNGQFISLIKCHWGHIRESLENKKGEATSLEEIASPF